MTIDVTTGLSGTGLEGLPAAQQPLWDDPDALAAVAADLRAEDGLVSWSEVERLSDLLASAARGEVCVLQAGDCAEDPADCFPAAVAQKIDLLDTLAEVMRAGARRPVLKVGRMAGQFAKPRSNTHEHHDGHSLPVYRGPAVNRPHPAPEARRSDPNLLRVGYLAAREVASSVDKLERGTECGDDRVWFSHEALLLDYEVPLVRPTSAGEHYLASTHWPWIGERTRRSDGAHVALLAGLRNPIASKVGPEAPVDEVLELCARLDPDRAPGRLTLIARYGASRIEALGETVEAVTRAGHPVLWMCDPMHGNTRTGEHDLKTRGLDDILREIEGFTEIVPAAGGTCAGLHLEASASGIRECEGAGTRVDGGDYYSLCDPRLNLTQGVAAAAHWRGDRIRIPGTEASA